MPIVTDVWRCGPPPRKGQKQRFPGRFFHYFWKAYPAPGETEGEVLHMFSGGIFAVPGHVTTDIRKEANPMHVAPYDALPFPDGEFALVLADPPYNAGFAVEWKADLPKPKRLLLEAARVTKPGGLIAILHIIVIPAYREANVERVALHAILCGPNNAVRVLNVFRKR